MDTVLYTHGWLKLCFHCHGIRNCSGLKVTYSSIGGRNTLHAFDYAVVRCCSMLGAVGTWLSLKLVKLESSTPNMLQKVATV